MLPSPWLADCAGSDPSALFEKARVYGKLPGIVLSVGIH